MLGTLGRSFFAAVPFLIVFLVFVYAFASSYLLVFGSQLGDYRNIRFASWSLFKTILGDFELDELATASYFLGPVLAVGFVALALFVILNMLVAIVLDAYQEEVDQLKRQPPHPVLPFLSAYANIGILSCCGVECRRWYRDQEQLCGPICGLQCSRRHLVLVELMCTPAGMEPQLPGLSGDSQRVPDTAQPSEVDKQRSSQTADGTRPAKSESQLNQPSIREALAQLIGSLSEQDRTSLMQRMQSDQADRAGGRGATSLSPEGPEPK